MYEATPQPARNSNGCPDCGAPMQAGYPAKYGWGTMTVWTCGKTHDDGPGYACPNKPVSIPEPAKAEAEAPEVSAAAPMVEADAPIAETFPVVLVDGVLQEVKTIPELSKAARLEEVLTHIETFSKMVVSKDDKKGADLADERRKLAKRIRVAVTKICKQEREEAVEDLKKIQNFWISTDNTIEARLKAVEEHLASQVKVYNDEKERIAKEAQAEKDRQAAEAAAEAKRILQERIQRIADLGATPNVVEIAAATDEQFEEMVDAAVEAQAALIARQNAERIERERLAEEQRARTVLIEGRTGELLRAGVAAFWKTLDELAEMDADEFAQKLADSIEAKALAEQEAEAARIEAEKRDAELARLRKDAAEREEAERLAREAQEKADREAREAAEAEARAAEEADRIERERPDREKLLRWLNGIDLELQTMRPICIEKRIHDMATAGITKTLTALQSLIRELEAA